MNKWTKFVALRPEVQEFAQAMERKLREHDEVKGEVVRGFDAGMCMDRIKEEFAEMLKAWDVLESSYTQGTVLKAMDIFQSEVLDVANFCMMLALRR